MEPSEHILEEHLRARIHALLAAADVEVTAAALMLFPVPSRPGCQVLVVPDGMHDAIHAIADRVGLEPVFSHRGVWLHTP